MDNFMDNVFPSEFFRFRVPKNPLGNLSVF